MGGGTGTGSFEGSPEVADLTQDVVQIPDMRSRLSTGDILALGQATRLSMSGLVMVSAPLTINGGVIDSERMSIGMMSETASPDSNGEWFTMTLPFDNSELVEEGGEQVETLSLDLAIHEVFLDDLEETVTHKRYDFGRFIDLERSVTFDIRRDLAGGSVDKILATLAPERLKRSAGILLNFSNVLAHYL